MIFYKSEDLSPKLEKHKRIVLFEEVKSLHRQDVFDDLLQRIDK